MRDKSELGIAQIREGLSALQCTGTGMRRPYFLALLAHALFCSDGIDEGLEVVIEAEALIIQTGETRWQSETVRLKGALMEQGDTAIKKTEATYQRAIKIAREQDARSLELRATTSLCRFWNKHGKESEARQLLIPLYGWFTEGFDTPDLIEAKALLKELQQP